MPLQIRRLMLALTISLVAIAGPAQAITTTTVGYLSPGSAFAETTTLDGVTVSMSATGALRATLPDSTPDIRFFRSTPSSVTWAFSKPIKEFSFDVRVLEPGEFFTTTLGAPTSLSGSLSLSAGKIIGSGSGAAFYSGLNVSSLTVTYGSARGDASVVGYGVTGVPLPSGLPLLLSGIALLGWRATTRRLAA